jgi:hypothetical protein
MSPVRDSGIERLNRSLPLYMRDKHDSKYGPMAMDTGDYGKSVTKEEKIAHLATKETKLQRMVLHVQKTKEALEASREERVVEKNKA